MAARRHTAQRAGLVLTASPILAHGLYRSLAGGGAAAPYGRDRRRGHQHGAEQDELPDRNGEIDAPIEGLAVDHINQDEAQHAAQSEAVENSEAAQEQPLAGQHADDLPAQHADVAQHAEFGAAGEGG